ncbi:hypothetical protein KHF85_18845 [Xanthomonas translucens pv. graminis]|uniref:hypothetical protein n=1 Tax=Xanthomonas graminis TaxID=3390026 RepID=UPI002540F598|nr:hypothetical protein [Xanthomonas translucens]WIH04789.1 hypothetical protein KHF85_18845 [Xanthomonas translucens pv. graminis]
MTQFVAHSGQVRTALARAGRVRVPHEAGQYQVPVQCGAGDRRQHHAARLAALADQVQPPAISERIVRSTMRDGFAELDAFKARHAETAWLKAIQPGSYTGLFLKFSSAELQANGAALAQGLSFDDEPRPVIEAITPRQLWLLAGSDRQAPNAATQAILRQLQQRRSDLAVVVFPNADHGLIESIKTADGVAKTYAAHLFDVTAHWIDDRQRPAPGKFIVMPVAD